MYPKRYLQEEKKTNKTKKDKKTTVRLREAKIRQIKSLFQKMQQLIKQMIVKIVKEREVSKKLLILIKKIYKKSKKQSKNK